MNIVCLGDLHLLWDKPIARLDDAHNVQKSKLKFVLDWAIKNRAIVIQPGDFFDTARSWHLTSAYSRFFSEYYDVLSINAVFGQHDTYMYSEKTRNATTRTHCLKRNWTSTRSHGNNKICTPQKKDTYKVLNH